MRLILLRHGHDLPGANGQQILSQQGRAQVAATIQQLPTHGVTLIDLALCADSLRARESLDVARERIPVTRALASPALHPGGSPEDLLALVARYALAQSEGTFLVVGHEPQLSNALLRAAGATLPPAAGPRAILARGDAVLAQPRFIAERWCVDPEELAFLGQAAPPLFTAIPRPDGVCSA